MIDYDQLLTKLLSFFHVMSREQNCNSADASQLFQLLPDFLTDLRIQSGGGLVKNQKTRFVQERSRDHQPSFHATGKMIDTSVTSIAQANEVEQFHRSSFGLVLWHAVVAGVNDEVPQDVQIRIEVVLLGDHPDDRSNRARLRAHVAAFHQEFTCAQRRATGNHAHRGRLARAVWPEQSEEHTSELQSHSDLVCRLLLEKKKRC